MPSYKTKIEHEIVADQFVGGVQKLQNEDIDAMLQLPRLLPTSNEMFCNIIQVFYELRVEVITEGHPMGSKLMTPIVIGSIPLVMDPSSVQPTFSGQSMVPPIDYQPVHIYSDAHVVSGNSNHDTAEYPPNNGCLNINYNDPPPDFDPRTYKLALILLMYSENSFQLRHSKKLPL